MIYTKSNLKNGKWQPDLLLVAIIKKCIARLGQYLQEFHFSDAQVDSRDC